MSEPLTDEELACIEAALPAGDLDDDSPEGDVRRLVAEVRRLRALATCEACADGLRLGDEGALHYDDARNGVTWGVCRRVVARHEREELLRLRAAGAPPGRPQS